MMRNKRQKKKEEDTQLVDPWSFRVAHRRLAWTFRLSAATNLVLLGVTMALTTALVELMPLKEIRPALLRSDPADNRIYRIEPISKTVDGYALLLEQMARRYVTLILTIDPISEESRLSEAARMTSTGYFETYKKSRIDNDFLKKAYEDRLDRSIKVTGTNQVSQRDGVYQFAVDFTQVDRRDLRVIAERPLRAYLSLTTRPQEVSEVDLYNNPLGIVVLDVAVKDRS